MSETREAFDSWAVVELFGHQRIAGRVSEAAIGGCSFIRVDVPETAKPPYTKYFGNGAIYAMTPCSEEVGQLAANEIERYHTPIAVQLPKQLAAPAAVAAGHDGFDPDDDE